MKHFLLFVFTNGVVASFGVAGLVFQHAGALNVLTLYAWVSAVIALAMMAEPALAHSAAQPRRSIAYADAAALLWGALSVGFAWHGYFATALAAGVTAVVLRTRWELVDAKR